MKYSTMGMKAVNTKENDNKFSSGIFLELYTLNLMIKKDDCVYGKEVTDYIGSFNLSWKPSNGTMYPIIEKMLTKGLIEVATKKERKKLYKITEKGRIYYNERADEFKQMLIESANFYNTIASELE
ncbi:TPA: PadR family transcriptional regulator [Clostridioides difficile]|uniref:PadR family transcriptional regulator n=1 Tax=Clostridioides difficile TaxID=1496 RepID=UPI00031F102C|nr:PadR family transcriptional regulator [Clostridioides difficile]AXU72274.1 Transcriptional regulator PadR-like family protein [Clostridioides difficile]MDK3178377.1 PadR family transcriptional regulator [Clostridioides difficile]MDN9856905.1 PadR family transcriptional regulator [Clostridioides difficile]MDV9594608.1 PadR family transcriptional regulator [Clostridioides difficile]HBF0841598.1 PadR family transcriptional regulator [Clostridioides difficile]